MANLPRFGRTWQRFSSLPRPGTASRSEIQPPPPSQTTEPEVYPYASTTTNNFQTSSPTRDYQQKSPRYTSPVKKFSSPPSSPKYRTTTAISPVKVPSPIPTNNRYDGERRTTATSLSPKAYKPVTHTSPPLSPAKPKYSAPTAAAAAGSLSPLTLPRSEPRYEAEHVRSRSPPQVQQKKILYEKTTTTTEKPSAKTDHRQSTEYSSTAAANKLPQQKHHQQQSEVIKMKGDNVGAIMHITQTSSDGGKEIMKKKPTNYNNENKGDEKLLLGNEEKLSNNMPAGKSFMNSNFQGVNNSIMYNSSMTHRDPGLHLSFSKNPKHRDHHSRH